MLLWWKLDRYIRKYDKTRYLALIHSNEKYERTFEFFISFDVTKAKAIFPTFILIGKINIYTIFYII